MMRDVELELGDCSFLHRRSRIHLHTKIIVKISCEDDCVDVSSDEVPLQTHFSSWFPRSQNLVWLLRLSFADDIETNLLGPQDVRRFIADRIADAELWRDLGYDTCHTELQGVRDMASERVMEMEFQLRSVSDDNLTAVCPSNMSTKHVQRVGLHLHFVGESHSVTVPKNTPSAVKLPSDHLWSIMPLSVTTRSSRCVSSRPLPRVTCSNAHRTLISNDQKMLQLENSKDSVYPKQKPPGLSSLDEETFMALLDIGIRSSIVSRPTKVAAGLKCLEEANVTRLSDISPSTFTSRYTQRFREQSSLIPSVFKWLGTFSARSPPTGDDNTGNDVYRRTLDIHRGLFMTVANGVRDLEGARKLRPLWSSKQLGNTRRVLETATTTLLEGTSEREDFFTNKAPSNDLFDLALDVNTQANYCVGYMPTVTSQRINDFGSATELRASGVYYNGQDPVDVTGIFHETDKLAESPPLLPSYAGSPSQRSDVSMIMALDEPMEEGCTIQRENIIGGRGWLTQNVIRMHPLRQHEQAPVLGDQVDHCRKRHDFLLDLEAGWSRDALIGLLLEEESDSAGLGTNGSPARSTTSLLDLGQPNVLQPSQSIFCNSDREDFPDDWPAFMSSNLQESPSNTSLADVLGTDHLLWHMWKRRASVVPRGEEDMLEMKIMYERDPDMKLFGDGWDLDPSDISSSSNEDPIIQQTAGNHSLPRERLPTPILPTSDRRSYCPPTRSSSSSSHVGRSDASPKPQRRGSIMKRFSWGGRQHSSDTAKLDMTSLGARAMEVKKRKTLDDYEMMDRESLNDDSNDMLF